LKKRSKKPLSVSGGPEFSFGAAGNLQKFFASFFQKRRPFFLCLTRVCPAPKDRRLRQQRV
jgi:hypothetical protein